MINKIKNKWNNIDKPGKLEFGILIFILTICYFIFNHGDIMITSTHGKDLLQLTFKGKFLTFYDYTNSTAVYLIPIYIMFAIWSIPVKIVYFIRGINLWGKLDYFGMNYVDLMWYKLLPVIFCILSCIIIKKILGELIVDERRKKWAGFIFLSFPILIFSQFIFGQYDSINMFFTTLGIYYFIKRKYYKFAVAFSFAITFKLFPIFIFIPLILLFEKRIFHIIKYLIIGMIGTVLSNALFIGSAGFKEAKAFTNSMIDRFFVSGIQTSFGMISIFLVLFIAACIYAYLTNENNKDKFNYISMYLCLFVYSSFYTFVYWHPQWVMLLVPMWVICMLISDNLKLSYILSIVLNISYLLITVCHWPMNVDESMINHGLLPVIFGKINKNGAALANAIGKIDYLCPDMLITLFAGVIILNLILKFPSKDRLNKYVKKEYKDMPEKGYIIGLLGVILIFIIPSIILYFMNI